MRFFTAPMAGSLRAAAQPSARFANKTPRLAMRNYSSETPKKSGGNGLIFVTLLGLGVAGGLYYNQSSSVSTHQTPAKEQPAGKASFDPTQFKSFKLIDKQKVTHDTSLFRFQLDSETDVSGLHTASCVITRYPITKKDGSPGYVIRPYTPTSTEETQGHVDFVIKNYANGKMSKHIHNLNIGDELEIKGPIGKYPWDEKKVENVGMVAGGTGITPMLQLIRRIFDPIHKDEKTKVTLIFGNRTEEDILLKEELDNYAKTHPDRFKVIYALDTAPADWDGIKGYVTKDDIQKYLPGPEKPSSIIFVCGPDPLLATVAGPKNPDKSQGEVTGMLKELGYDSSNVYKF
ncbi:uncharacterized protein BX664DRAFT_334845 [Halteromyces radiatus]|uniref:uncharacterized protein n=1 Tax=Halteromyces radiatus TaxID=101107 RepID=UPI00221EAD4A|nr:uncharacterized protein BX664DRAFT_334845 [Halteromyces radiatus]KAI8086072.1 hypothetical protein BX664DRAFT_334845 [Halteromyces radiatus]